MAKKIIVFIILYFIYIPLIMFYGMTFMVANVSSNGYIILPLLIAFMVVPLFIFLAVYNRPSKKQRELLLRGQDAEAIVVRVEDTGVTVNGLYINVRLFLRVQPQSAQPFEAKTEALFSRVNLPRPGDKLSVKYDPNDKNEIVLSKS